MTPTHDLKTLWEISNKLDEILNLIYEIDDIDLRQELHWGKRDFEEIVELMMMDHFAKEEGEKNDSD